MRDAGLETRIDAAANIIGSRPGKAPGLRPILMGSHIDSVPEGGNFDGDVGSLGAIEVAQVLAERGTSTRHPLQIMIFQNEEGCTIGSMAATAALNPKQPRLLT